MGTNCRLNDLRRGPRALTATSGHPRAARALSVMSVLKLARFRGHFLAGVERVHHGQKLGNSQSPPAQGRVHGHVGRYFS